MGKRGPLDDGFANGVRFGCGALVALLLLARMLLVPGPNSIEDFHHVPVRIILAAVALVLLFGVVAAISRDDS
jgi:hypothetical protein